MLINNWYVAARTSEVANTPFKSRMLGLDFVLFRDDAGKAHCVSDVCVHRGGALHRGQVNGCQIACPYHGWEFNTDGACTKIPALGDDITIPKRARIDAYPVEERLGFIWVFLGDAAEADRPQIPMWYEPFLNAPDQWRIISYDYTYTDVNWARLGENSTDTAHPSFVHKQFGNRLSPKAVIVPIESTEYGARTVRERAAPPRANKSEAMAKILPTDRKTTKVTLEFSMVGITEMLYQEMTTEITQVLFSARTPIDEYNTKSYGYQARNFLMEPEHDAERMKGLLQAAQEDHDIVRFVKPKLTPQSTTEEFLIESDGMELTYRRKVQEYARKFGAIDREAFERAVPNKIMVIPSPLRKADPKGWVHKTVPLQTVASSDVLAAE